MSSLVSVRMSVAAKVSDPLTGLSERILSWGLRTVDGSYNSLLNPNWGSSGREFSETLGTDFRTLFVDGNPGPDVTMVPISGGNAGARRTARRHEASCEN